LLQAFDKQALTAQRARAVFHKSLIISNLCNSWGNKKPPPEGGGMIHETTTVFKLRLIRFRQPRHLEHLEHDCQYQNRQRCQEQNVGHLNDSATLQGYPCKFL